MNLFLVIRFDLVCRTSRSTSLLWKQLATTKNLFSNDFTHLKDCEMKVIVWYEMKFSWYFSNFLTRNFPGNHRRHKNIELWKVYLYSTSCFGRFVLRPSIWKTSGIFNSKPNQTRCYQSNWFPFNGPRVSTDGSPSKSKETNDETTFR